MTKFSWKNFLNKRNYIAVHCKTKEEAIDFCKQMHKYGMKWCNGESYFYKIDWDIYRSDTCYGNHGTYGTMSSYKYSPYDDYTIFEYNDIFNEDRIETVEEFIMRTGRKVEYTEVN